MFFIRPAYRQIFNSLIQVGLHPSIGFLISFTGKVKVVRCSPKLVKDGHSAISFDNLKIEVGTQKMSLSQQFSPLVVCDGFHLIYSANYTVHDTKSGISTRNSTFEILPITFTSYFETCTGILQPVTCIDKLRRIIIANGCIFIR